MKRGTLLLVISLLCLSLSSCTAKNSPTQNSADDAYLEGLSQGYENVFLNLWQAGSGVKSLEMGEIWETDQFTITVHSDTDDWGNTIRIELTTKKLTISECFEEKRMFINVFSHDGEEFEGLFTDNLFHMNALLEQYDEHFAQATVRIYDNADSVAILIAVDGCIYKGIILIT